jgi:ribosomal protein S18 acetylase RimI-like enzyme
MKNDRVHMSSNVMIREIQARDLPDVAAVHMLAFPESALTLLGTEAVRRYYEWQLVGPHDVVALSAMLDSELVGFCFGGIFRGAMSGFVRKNRKFLIGHVLAHPYLVRNPIFRNRLATGARVLKSHAKPAAPAPGPSNRSLNHFGILAIAVHPQRQGLGIGKVLMAEAEAVARRQGFQEMDLTVNPTNLQAVEFYERLNWTRFSKDTVWKGQMKKSLAS